MKASLAGVLGAAIGGGALLPAASMAAGVGWEVAGGGPAELANGLTGLLAQPGPAGFGSFARPSVGALAARGPESVFRMVRAKFPHSLQSLPLPAAFSVILWVRMSSTAPSTALFGLGEPDGDYLLAATDSTGAPTLAFLTQEKLTHFDRAKIGASNLADGRLHAVVAVVNLGSGLARLYVDGRPETATTISLWRPRGLGSAFALYALQGRTDAPGNDTQGLLIPRLIPRELSDQEIALIKPGAEGSEAAFIPPELGERLIRDTLMEFWPAQFSHVLRWRPL
jgi:hypothetical protein